MASGYAVLSLFLPVTDGLTQPSWQAFAHVLFIKSIGPYWFLHLMVVCGVLYYAAFRVAPKVSMAAKLSIFATPHYTHCPVHALLNISFAAYYFVGVAIRHLVKDFSMAHNTLPLFGRHAQVSRLGHHLHPCKRILFFLFRSQIAHLFG